jgi:hypothetical protein
MSLTFQGRLMVKTLRYALPSAQARRSATSASGNPCSPRQQVRTTTRTFCHQLGKDTMAVRDCCTGCASAPIRGGSIIQPKCGLVSVLPVPAKPMTRTRRPAVTRPTELL